MVGFTAVCAQGFAFLHYWSVPVSKLSFSLRSVTWESNRHHQHCRSTVLWGCCRAVTAALLAHSTQGKHLLIDRLGNHGTARWKRRRFYSKLSFKIQTGTWIDWREQPASGSQPVTLAVKRALVELCVNQPKWCTCTLHPTSTSSCWGSWIPWVLSQDAQQRGAGWWVRSTGSSSLAAMACCLWKVCVMWLPSLCRIHL